ncbi:MAG: GatB/YqeY domain-containing protein [Blastocatellia bacterium]|nr:GatB/YqeY domain-containing protein [Blastocatellia bacterium]
MTALEKINQDITAAMKAKDEIRLSTLRMMKTALKKEELEREKGQTLSEAEAVKILQSLLKQRRDSIEQFTKGGRQELADKEAAEMKIIEEYLPAALDEAALGNIVEATIAEMGAASSQPLGPPQMGLVMKAVMAKLAGQTVDGKVVSALVKSKLGG